MVNKDLHNVQCQQQNPIVITRRHYYSLTFVSFACTFGKMCTL